MDRISKVFRQFQERLSLLSDRCYWLIDSSWCLVHCLIMVLITFDWPNFQIGFLNRVVHCVVVLFGCHVCRVLENWRLVAFYWMVQLIRKGKIGLTVLLPTLALFYGQPLENVLLTIHLRVQFKLLSLLILRRQLVNRKGNNLRRGYLSLVWGPQSNFCNRKFALWIACLFSHLWRMFILRLYSMQIVLCHTCLDRSEGLCNNRWFVFICTTFVGLGRKFNLDWLFFMEGLQKCFPITDVWAYFVT